MDPNRSNENVNLAVNSASAGSDIPLQYYDQITSKIDGSKNEMQEQKVPSSVFASTSDLGENDFSLGGYSGPWGSYIGTFDFPVDTLSTTAQLTPEQLAELDEYINALSQQESSTHGGCTSTESYPVQNSSQNCGFEDVTGNIDFAHSGRQIYTDALNCWSNIENTHYEEGTYNPFSLTSSVFQNNGSTSNAFVDKSTFEPTETHNSKPSFAEVAKNNAFVNHDNGSKSIVYGKTARTDKRDTKSFQERKSVNPGLSFHNPSKNQTKKVKSSRTGNLQRSKSMPVEPAEIKPNSRYGLDTFEDRSPTNERVITKTTVSCGNSRKNSTSSMSSGISGMEEIHLSDKVTCDSSHQSNDCDYFGANYKLETNSKPQNCGANTRDRKGVSRKFETMAQKGKVGEELYFDPRKIFQDSKQKNSKSVQTNNEDYVPNNKQKLQPEKESLLNKEKPKASVKSGSTNYINNDLRDNKKYVNIEQDRENDGKDARHRSNFGGHGRNRSRLSKSETDPHSKNCIKGNRKDKSENTKYLLGEWLLEVYKWLLWGGGKLLNFLWNLLKLVLSVILLLLALTAHYTIIFCAKLWSFIQKKVPYFRRKLEQDDFEWSSPLSQPRPKQYGLKENIILPNTGNEAMKRLISCKGKDPYSILGVRADASDEDIKKYYRKQAVLVHPDKNKQPGAEEAFKILGHAFELIGTVEKRKEYDAHLEMKDAETAMQEFADLLTKLHDKMQEASNLLRCDHCGGKHKRVPTDRPMYSARFCDRCNTRHSVKEGDVWAESKILGFLWHYYACMEGKIFDITEWASCKHDNFKSMQANSHQVIYRLSTGGGRAKHNNSRSGEANLEDFLNTLFHTATSNLSGEGPNGCASGGGTAGGSSAGPNKPSKSGRKKKKKH